MANSCISLPENIILSCILTRVPVKSILRSKSVCKAWLHHLSTPEFLKLHHAQFSSDPRNQSLILFSFHRCTTRVMNNINSIIGQSKQAAAMFVDLPYGPNSTDVHIIGCCNGLICTVRPERQRGFVLWNPAMRLSKFVPLWKLDFGKLIIMESLGFGYDAEGDDFKVVKIVRESYRTNTSVVEVYSVRSDSWTTIKLDFQFVVVRTKCELIVNGNPYWFVCVGSDQSEAFVYFDATKEDFKTVPVPSFLQSQEVKCKLVDMNGSLGALVWKHDFIDDIGTESSSLDVWVFDEIWRKVHSLGHVEVSVNRFLQCLRNGNIVGDRVDGDLFVFDPYENDCVFKILIDQAEKYSFDQVYGYTESLAQIKGMKQVVCRDMISRNS